MELSFFGAAREVTGSCYHIKVGDKNAFVDCGMHQGGDDKYIHEFPIPANQLDYVFLTHSHIDHSGRIPLLMKEGFSGKIFLTDATGDLCSIMLQDSAHIQEMEASYDKRKAERAGREPKQPLYTMDDALAAIGCFTVCPYESIVKIDENFSVRFRDIGHLLGSASIEVFVNENGVSKTLVFSGDVGNINQPLIKDPKPTKEADYVVVESTYGNRYHNAPPDYAVGLAEIIQKTFDRGGNVIIPSFAVGRAQEILYFIRHIKENNMVKGHDKFPVYLDSPLANEATQIFKENYKECYDKEAMDLINRGINPIGFEGLKLSISSDDSKAINFDLSPKVIISAAGMCDAGRIRHHLKHNLWKRECSVIFVGYQAVGSTGRYILDGAEDVKLFGERIEVRAEILRLEGISAHADKQGLTDWVKAFSPTPKKIFVTHGQNEVCAEFAQYLRGETNTEVVAPLYSSRYDIATGECIYEGAVLQREQKEQHFVPSKQKAQKPQQQQKQPQQFNNFTNAIQYLEKVALEALRTNRLKESTAVSYIDKITRKIKAHRETFKGRRK